MGELRAELRMRSGVGRLNELEGELVERDHELAEPSGVVEQRLVVDNLFIRQHARDGPAVALRVRNP